MSSSPQIHHVDEPNTAFPWPPGYPPQITGDRQPLPVTAPGMKYDDTASAISGAEAAITHADNMFRRHLNSIDAEAYSPDGLRQQILAFGDTAAAKAIDAAVAGAEQRATEAAAHVDQVRKDLSPVGDAAAELRAGRYWHRTERHLDGVEDRRVVGAARDLVARANAAELGTLLEELGGYLTTRGQSTEWINGIVAEKIPELHKAMETLKKAVQARTVIQYNASEVRSRIAETRSPSSYRPPILVGVMKYDPDSTD